MLYLESIENFSKYKSKQMSSNENFTKVGLKLLSTTVFYSGQGMNFISTLYISQMFLEKTIQFIEFVPIIMMDRTKTIEDTTEKVDAKQTMKESAQRTLSKIGFCCGMLVVGTGLKWVGNHYHFGL